MKLNEVLKKTKKNELMRYFKALGFEAKKIKKDELVEILNEYYLDWNNFKEILSYFVFHTFATFMDISGFDIEDNIDKTDPSYFFHLSIISSLIPLQDGIELSLPDDLVDLLLLNCDQEYQAWRFKKNFLRQVVWFMYIYYDNAPVELLLKLLNMNNVFEIDLDFVKNELPTIRLNDDFKYYFENDRIYFSDKEKIDDYYIPTMMDLEVCYLGNVIYPEGVDELFELLGKYVPDIANEFVEQFLMHTVSDDGLAGVAEIIIDTLEIPKTKKNAIKKLIKEIKRKTRVERFNGYTLEEYEEILSNKN